MKKIIKELKDSTFTILVIIGISILTYSYLYTSNSENDSHSTGIQNITYDRDLQMSTNITNLYENNTKLDISLATKEDKKLISAIEESDDIFMKYIKDAQSAAKENNLKSLETAGINIRKDSQKYLNVSNNINVSSSFDILLDEYKKSLNNYNKAGRLIEFGSRIPGSNDLVNSITYIKEGKRHMDMTINLISG